jgi:hypothetical protein
MKQLIYLKAVFFILLCISCGNINNKSSSNDIIVRLVFYDFYDQKVLLKINGKKVVDDRLTVTELSTGVCLIKEISVKQKSLFELEFDGKRKNIKISVDRSVKTIYLSPNEPYITISDSEIILLD